MLEMRDVHKRFGPLHVLRGVDLDVRAGEILALVGENGAGKSTIVQCIARTFGHDRGGVEVDGVPIAPDPLGAGAQGVAVVWQDLALCDNLGAVENLFLGDERLVGPFLDDGAMLIEAEALFSRLHLPPVDLRRPVGTLSGGERQLVALARALKGDPTVVVLDEPTASLGVHETAIVERLLAGLRSRGTAVLLVSHRLEQVFKLADRIAVLRDGHIMAIVSPLEVHPDDVAAMIAGVETDSTARRQLQRLRSLVEQLADVEPAATLPLIVSATAEALGVERLCVHLLVSKEGEAPHLRRSATVGLTAPACELLEVLPIGPGGGLPGTAAGSGRPAVADDLRSEEAWKGIVALEGLRGCWSVPIVGAGGVLGTITGFAETIGRPQPDQLELVWLYASHAAGAIEREVLLADATRRNRVLETLRGVLDTLAGPAPEDGGMSLALLALCRGLSADSITLHQPGDGVSEFHPATLQPADAARASSRQLAAAAEVRRSSPRLDRARPVGGDVIAVPISAPDGRAVVTAWWADAVHLSDDALDLLDDAARSLSLALEREAFERANAEADSLRRSQRLQRDFLFRLNHELKTPLTAIQGFAWTLRQADVTWDDRSQARFLDSIASESERMGRLVGDLLDFSAIDSGTLRLLPDWCDLSLVLDAARACVGDATSIEVSGCADLPPVWADHDRLEQVFVNLFENAARHATGLSGVTVSASLDDLGAGVDILVVDDGVGMAPDLARRAFVAHERGGTSGSGAGLGLAIARGIIEAHGGSIGLQPSSCGTTVAVRLPIEPAPGAIASVREGAGARDQ